MSSKASQYLGSMRECAACGDEKIVSEQTYALHNKLKGGWHTVCRVCQSVENSVSNSEGMPQKHRATVTLRTKGELTDMIDEGKLQGKKTDWGCWVARLKREEIEAVLSGLSVTGLSVETLEDGKMYGLVALEG